MVILPATALAGTKTCPDGYNYKPLPKGKNFQTTKVISATFGEDIYSCERIGAKMEKKWNCRDKIWGRSVGDLDEKWFIKDQTGKSHKFSQIMVLGMNPGIPGIWKRRPQDCVDFEGDGTQLACQKTLEFTSVLSHEASNKDLRVEMIKNRKSWCEIKPKTIDF